MLASLGVNCDRLDAPDNGQIRLTGTTLGSRAMYICNKGFMLEGDALRTCQENGEWSGEDPICMRKSVPHGGEIVDDI